MTDLAPAGAAAGVALDIRRVRHPLQVRALTVAAVQPLAPHMCRLTLVEAVRGLPPPGGRGHAFAAAESHTVRAVREVLVERHGLAKGQVRASAYWRRGASAHHENLEG